MQKLASEVWCPEHWGLQHKAGLELGGRELPHCLCPGEPGLPPTAPAEGGTPLVLRELVCTDSPLTVAGACGGSHPDSTPDWGEAQAGWGHGPSLGRLGLAGPEQ